MDAEALGPAGLVGSVPSSRRVLSPGFSASCRGPREVQLAWTLHTRSRPKQRPPPQVSAVGTEGSELSPSPGSGRGAAGEWMCFILTRRPQGPQNGRAELSVT